MYGLVTLLIFAPIVPALAYDESTIFCSPREFDSEYSFPVSCSKSTESYNCVYEIKVFNHSQDFWDNHHNPKIEECHSRVKNTKLTFVDFEFPRNFSLYDFSRYFRMTEVGHLRLAQPKFTSPTSGFLFRMNITHLEIERANFKSLPDDFLLLPKLHTLKIRFSALEKLQSRDFVIPRRIRKLDLSDNRISVIEPGTFDFLEDLMILELKNNRLSELPADLFRGVQSLKTLSLGGNGNSTLPAEIFRRPG